MRRVLSVLFILLFLTLATAPAEGFHWRRWGCGFRAWPSCVSYRFSCFPRVYCRPICYPRVVTYVSPWICSTPVYSSHVSYGRYVGRTNYVPSANYVNYRLPPVAQPAELAYGPQSVKQFMGVSRNFGLGSLLNPTDRNALIRPVVTDLKIRATNVSTLEKARNYIATGDRLFRQQKFHSALQQYKAATRFAPDLADGFFRQGHALVATNRYDLAAQVFKRGLKVDSEVADSKFLLSSIYGDARIAKTAHLDSLATAALKHDHNSDLMFLVGVFLHYDGSKDRATKFFERANDLAGADNVHLAHFLPRKERAPESRADIRLASFSGD